MHPQLQNPKRRKILIYGGMAAAILLVFLLTRRSSSSAAPASQTPTAQPVSNPATDPASYYSGGSGAGGIDYAPRLAALDTDIQTLAQGVNALQTQSQTPGSSTPGTGGTDTAGLITAITGAIVAGATIGGQKPPNVNVNVTAPKQHGPGNKPPKKAPPKIPAGWKHAPSGPRKPDPPKGFVTIGLGSGNWGYKPQKGPGNRGPKHNPGGTRR